ncbi:hypothetical protein [[Mycoplasma] testudinis]|uniref:hypothetical protein n=1 Tax=[Mycoplasma] testudinis TaxID=33924 RepID=UPI00048444F4|nr:hypothetical protein [[Mycoplasma] testudinis]
MQEKTVEVLFNHKIQEGSWVIKAYEKLGLKFLKDASEESVLGYDIYLFLEPDNWSQNEMLVQSKKQYDALQKHLNIIAPPKEPAENYFWGPYVFLWFSFWAIIGLIIGGLIYILINIKGNNNQPAKPDEVLLKDIERTKKQMQLLIDKIN